MLALKTLQIKRLALATPYHDALNEHEVGFLDQYDISVIKHKGLGYGANGPEEYRNIARIQPAAVAELVRQVDDTSAEAILISCTDLATLAVIHELENTLKKPVISSNTATFWAALAKAGIRENLTGYGVLLESIGFG